jgi:hypothetical protein
MTKKKINLIQNFIVNNSLDFSGRGSGLNGNCVILAGYACYLGVDSIEELIEGVLREIDEESERELIKVFNYAKKNNYGEYWLTEDAKKTYVF